MAAFLERAGAWSADLISPPSNVSDAGMRMLQDQVAWLRPGPLYLVTVRSPDDLPALAAANRFVLGPRSRRSRERRTCPSYVTRPCCSRRCSPRSTPSSRSCRERCACRSGPVRPASRGRFTARSPGTAFRLFSAKPPWQDGSNALTSRSVTPRKVAAVPRALERVLAQLNDPLEQQAIRTTAKQALDETAERFARAAPSSDEALSVRDRRGGIVSRWSAWRGRLSSANIPSGSENDSLPVTVRSRLMRAIIGPSVMVRTVFDLVVDVFHFVGLCLRSHGRLAAENLFLRKQLALYLESQVKPHRARNATCLTLVVLARFIKWRPVLTIVQPAARRRCPGICFRCRRIVR